MKLAKRSVPAAIVIVAGLVAAPLMAFAAGGVVTDPNGIAPDRYVYYPGTEALGEDEIRIIACGTGMPAARHGQAASCWLMEVGNGDKFLFDIGSVGSWNVAIYLHRVACFESFVGRLE